jgi:hypothetical protein
MSRNVSIDKIGALYTEIVNQPNPKHPEEGIEERDQKAFQEITIKDAEHAAR